MPRTRDTGPGAPTVGPPPVPDAIVVGSGFGGAVVAARLAEAGLRVLVLERGPWWGRGGDDASPSDRRPFPRGPWGARKLLRGVRWSRRGPATETLLHPDGLWEWHAFAHADVFTASGVGGGSLVYTNIQERPDDAFVRTVFPPEVSPEELAPYYERVRAMLRPARSPYRPPKERAFARAVDQVGLGRTERPELAVAWGQDPHVAERHVTAAGTSHQTCVNVGECVIGCPYGAKASLDVTYLPLALARGAQVRALCEVTAIGRARRGYRVRYHDHRSGARVDVEAPRLVLTCGTLNTLRLLLAARDRLGTLPELPPRLGRGVTLNGDVAALLLATALPTRADDGPAINAFHRVRGPSGGTRYVIGEAGLPLNGLPLPRWLKHRLRRSAVLFGYGREGGDARVTLDGRHLRSDAGQAHDPELYRALDAAAAALTAAYGPRWSSTGDRTPTSRRRARSVHPLGGAAIGRTVDDGVVDHTGQVFGHPGLYVADGSLYPVAPGIPPSMTIAALAERIADLATR